MTQIHIKEFTTYDKDTTLEFLRLQADTEFEIILPRKAIFNKDPQWYLSIDFRDAAYIGYLLSQVVDSFGYYVPCPYKDEPFQFRVVIRDMEKFAEQFHFIARGISNLPDHQETVLTFQIASLKFYENANYKDLNSKVYGLTDIAVKFHSDEGL